MIFYSCYYRLTKGDFEVEPNPMIVVASCAVIFNILLGLLLRGVPHSHGHSHGGGGGGMFFSRNFRFRLFFQLRNFT